jgi:hypothetical protein
MQKQLLQVGKAGLLKAKILQINPMVLSMEILKPSITIKKMSWPTKN